MKNCIKRLRKEMGLRQEDIAANLGVSRQTIIAIENDKYNPSLELAMKLAKELGKSVEEIFFLEHDVTESVPETSNGLPALTLKKRVSHSDG